MQRKTVSTPQSAVCNDPTVEVSGIDPQYEMPSATANQDYERDDKSYRTVQDSVSFTQAGFAVVYDAESNSNLTVGGETFNPTQSTAAHLMLPVPSYVRTTGLVNDRVTVMWINDRGPYGGDHVISLSCASVDRLNTSNSIKVRIDPIIVVPNGSLSGPEMACITVAKQTYVLSVRPNLDGGGATSMNQPAPADVRLISNSTLKPEDSVGVPVNSDGFLGAPVPLNSGVLESNEPAAMTVATMTPAVAAATQMAPAIAPGSIQGNVATTAVTATVASAVTASSTATSSASSSFVTQVGVVSDQARAQQYQQRLS